MLPRRRARAVPHRGRRRRRPLPPRLARRRRHARRHGRPRSHDDWVRAEVVGRAAAGRDPAHHARPRRCEYLAERGGHRPRGGPGVPERRRRRHRGRLQPPRRGELLRRRRRQGVRDARAPREHLARERPPDRPAAHRGREKEYQALHDTLTGLGNRNLFVDRAPTQAVRESRDAGWRVAVMLMDLNRFKDVNDTLGHHHGDMLLRQVAARLARRRRPTATIARLGGDEFAVLLPQIRSDAQAEQVAIEIQLAMQQPFSSTSSSSRSPARSASRSRPTTATTPRRCSSTPTSRCTTRRTARQRRRALRRTEHNQHSHRRLALAGELQGSDRRRRARGLLPAEGRPADGPGHRRRGAAALGAPSARTDPARRVRPARRRAPARCGG